MVKLFKHLELGMWENGENLCVCLFPVPQSFSVSYLPALTPSCSITSRGHTTGAELLEVVFICPELSIASKISSEVQAASALCHSHHLKADLSTTPLANLSFFPQENERPDFKMSAAEQRQDFISFLTYIIC